MSDAPDARGTVSPQGGPPPRASRSALLWGLLVAVVAFGAVQFFGRLQERPPTATVSGAPKTASRVDWTPPPDERVREVVVGRPASEGEPLEPRPPDSHGKAPSPQEAAPEAPSPHATAAPAEPPATDTARPTEATPAVALAAPPASATAQKIEAAPPAGEAPDPPVAEPSPVGERTPPATSPGEGQSELLTKTTGGEPTALAPAAREAPPTSGDSAEVPTPAYALQLGAFLSHRYRHEAEARAESLGLPYFREQRDREGVSYCLRFRPNTPDEGARAAEALTQGGYLFEEVSGGLEARFPLEEEAQAALELLEREGLAATYAPQQGSIFWLVFAGPFAQEQALAARERLARQGIESMLRTRQ